MQNVERYVRRNVTKLTHRHKSTQPVPWKMGDAQRDFIDTMVKAIVGLQIEITGHVGKAKLSQNEEQRDIRNAGEMVSAQVDHPISQAMLSAAARKG
nr:FMN-binding negative transcriptional regulator [Ensifer sp. YR511]